MEVKKILLLVLFYLFLFQIPNTIVYADYDEGSLYTLDTEILSKKENSFEAVLIWGNYIYDPTNSKFINNENYMTRFDYTIMSREIYALIFEKNEDEFYIKRKSDGKYMKRDDNEIKWVESKTYASSWDFELKNNEYYHISDSLLNSINIEDYKLTISTSSYGRIKVYSKSGYEIKYMIDNTVVSLDFADINENGHFVVTDFNEIKTNGSIIEYWVDYDNKHYIPNVSYFTSKSIMLKPVYHKHNYSETIINEDGNNIGYKKYTCTCGHSYIDSLTKENSIKKIEFNQGKLKVTYTDGTTSEFDSIKGETGENGREVEFQVSETYIQWRYKGENNWNNLIALSTITGAKGEKGDPGKDGQDGQAGKDGQDGQAGKDGQDGKDGETPFIGENGNWWIGKTDTGVKAISDYEKQDDFITSAKIDENGDLILNLANGQNFKVVNNNISNEDNLVKILSIIAIIISIISLSINVFNSISKRKLLR